ncbi:DNA mismatch repair protein MutS [bacterium]|nr:DNA mismatch repair protein MutS [bacterium]
MAKANEQNQMTPLFQQYFGLKEAHKDCLVLMQCGDFYEAYGEDAEIFSRELEIVLTAKECGGGRKIPMAGIPIHAIEPYLRGLVGKGHRVALAEQTMLPSECKGLVPREVTRIVTAGTVLDLQSLDEKSHNYLVCLYAGRDGKTGFAAADIGTGDFCGCEFAAGTERILEEALRFNPSEIIITGSVNDDIKAFKEKIRAALGEVSISFSSRSLNLKQAREILYGYFKLASLAGLGFEDSEQCLLALACLLDYVTHLACDHEILLEAPKLLNDSGELKLDLTTRRNLELTETLLGRKREGSLLGSIDRTCTSMGARALKEWMLRPLCSLEGIKKRHDICEALLRNDDCRGRLRQELKGIVDMERLTARISYGTFNARELLGVALSLSRVPRIYGLIKAMQLPPLQAMADALEADLGEYIWLSELLQRAIDPEAPLTLREGGIIKDGYNAELDELRSLRRSGEKWVSELEERERAQTGIKNLKVGYNSVFGYYIEVTKANLPSVPVNYVRKQTLVNCERYITSELKEHEVKIIGAEEKIKKLEYNLFQDLRAEASKRQKHLHRLAHVVAELDVLASFAQLASERGWVRPRMTEERTLSITGGRHPVVEEHVDGFVPNDCNLSGEKPIVILTGPNMSGKSTWLRQTAQIAVLAQMGAFVPAASASLPVFDRIFTRVGASDDLHLGRSTFMVEMSETANIINNSTGRSLVILDEIGRGTSTFDGLAIAQAVVEYLHDGPRPLTLFATHFHELTKLGDRLKGCRNFRVAVKELPDEVVFLHKIVPGGANRSYGIYVAKLAGMPETLLRRAENILRRMEQNQKRCRSALKEIGGVDMLALDFGDEEEKE